MSRRGITFRGAAARAVFTALTGRKVGPEAKQESVNAWNKVHAIGAPVIVRDDHGKERKTKTRSEAWVMGGHTAMILLEGISGGYMLERVRPDLPSTGETDRGQGGAS